jgi:general stress protein YciG
MPKSTRGFIIEYVDMPKPTRGFASMSKAKRQAIARLGGIAGHTQGKAHQWKKEEASRAGRKGGLRRNITGIREMNS